MKVEIENSQATATTLIVQADSNDMAATKTRIQADLTAGIKLPGFRQGKVPPELALKEINENLLSETFLKVLCLSWLNRLCCLKKSDRF